MPPRPQKPRGELIFEEEDDAPNKGSGTGDNEFVTDDDEFEVDEPRTGLVISRRKLLLGALATVLAAGVGGYALLREKGPAGSELMDKYEEIAGVDPEHRNKVVDKKMTLRQMFVLEQVADRNMPSTYNDFVTIEVTGKNGTVVRFKAAPHGLRIGHNDDWIEVPLDGPHAMAAAEILGYTLPTPWMVRAIAHQAMKFAPATPAPNCKSTTWCAEKADITSEGRVPFIYLGDIAHKLDIAHWNDANPDRWWQTSPQFIRGRNLLLHGILAKHKIKDDQLIAGYAKEVCLRSEQIGPQRLEMVGGYDANGQIINLPSAGHHEAGFFDYSHIVRFIESDKLEVQEAGSTETKPMTIDEFSSTIAYANEFSFDRTRYKKRAYPYDRDLAVWMGQHGYIREEYDTPAEKKTREAAIEKKKKADEKAKKMEEKKK